MVVQPGRCGPGPADRPIHADVRRLLLTLFVGLFAGCGGKPEPPATGTARGRVLFAGRPLAGGRVVFAPHPDRGPVAKRAVAELDENGEFRLASNGTPYLTPGWYRVAIADPPGGDGLPSALRRPDLSGLEREVIAGRDNVFEFHVELLP